MHQALPATKLNYWWPEALELMGFVTLAMMIVWVIMTPRIALVVRMLMTALLASMGESLRPNPQQGLVSLHQAAIA